MQIVQRVFFFFFGIILLGWRSHTISINFNPPKTQNNKKIFHVLIVKVRSEFWVKTLLTPVNLGLANNIRTRYLPLLNWLVTFCESLFLWYPSFFCNLVRAVPSGRLLGLFPCHYGMRLLETDIEYSWMSQMNNKLVDYGCIASNLDERRTPN